MGLAQLQNNLHITYSITLCVLLSMPYSRHVLAGMCLISHVLWCMCLNSLYNIISRLMCLVRHVFLCLSIGMCLSIAHIALHNTPNNGLSWTTRHYKTTPLVCWSFDQAWSKNFVRSSREKRAQRNFWQGSSWLWKPRGQVLPQSLEKDHHRGIMQSQSRHLKDFVQKTLAPD